MGILSHSAPADWETGCSGSLRALDRMQQQARGQPTYRFSDAESGCHLSSALMATPGTENKQTNRPNVNFSLRHPIEVAGVAHSTV